MIDDRDFSSFYKKIEEQTRHLRQALSFLVPKKTRHPGSKRGTASRADRRKKRKAARMARRYNRRPTKRPKGRRKP